jgi:hypothetical protein
MSDSACYHQLTPTSELPVIRELSQVEQNNGHEHPFRSVGLLSPE